MTNDNSIPLPEKRQVNNPLERAYFEQFSSYAAADDFADGARAWVIECGFMPIKVIADSDTTCIVAVSMQDYIDLSNQPSDPSVYVIVDHETVDIVAGIVEVYIWHIAEVVASYATGGVSGNGGEGVGE